MMKTKLPLSLAPALAATLLAACSSSPSMPDRAWSVEPVSNVAHAGRSAAEHYTRGYHSEGRSPDEALSAYRNAVEKDPEFLPAWNAMGMLHARLGQHDEAVAAFQKAVQVSPDSGELQNNLGYAQLLAREDQAAVTTLRHAVLIDRENRRAWRNLAVASRRIGDLDNAERAAARASAPAAGGSTAQTLPVTLDEPEALAQSGTAMSRAGQSAEGATTGPQLVKIAENIYELRNGSRSLARSNTPSSRSVASSSAEAATSRGFQQVDRSDASGGVRYEVSNGVGRSGLAGRVARMMREEGVAQARLTNQPPFNEPITMVEYREGFRQTAERLAESLPFRPALMAGPSNDIQADVRLLLGHDLATASKCATVDLCPIQEADEEVGSAVAESAGEEHTQVAEGKAGAE